MKLVKVISNVRVVYAIEIHGFRAFKANKLLEKWLGFYQSIQFTLVIEWLTEENMPWKYL